MTDNMVSTTPPAQTGLDGAAAVNSAKTQVSVIVGGGSGANAVTIYDQWPEWLSSFGTTLSESVRTVSRIR